MGGWGGQAIAAPGGAPPALTPPHPPPPPPPNQLPARLLQHRGPGFPPAAGAPARAQQTSGVRGWKPGGRAIAACVRHHPWVAAERAPAAEVGGAAVAAVGRVVQRGIVRSSKQIGKSKLASGLCAACCDRALARATNRSNWQQQQYVPCGRRPSLDSRSSRRQICRAAERNACP